MADPIIIENAPASSVRPRLPYNDWLAQVYTARQPVAPMPATIAANSPDTFQLPPFVPRYKKADLLKMDPAVAIPIAKAEGERYMQWQAQNERVRQDQALQKFNQGRANTIADANVADAIPELNAVLSALANTQQQIKQAKLTEAKLAGEARDVKAPVVIDPATKMFIPTQSTNALAQVAAEKLNSIKIDIENLLVREKQLNDAAEALKITGARDGYRFSQGGYFTNAARQKGTPAVTLPTLPTLATTNTMPKSSIYEQRVRQLQQQGVSPADIDRLFSRP